MKMARNWDSGLNKTIENNLKGIFSICASANLKFKKLKHPMFR